MRRLIDISPTINANLAVWPGDTPPQRKILSSLKHGSNIDLSTLEATVHLGAHADAPSHYAHAGRCIASQSLEPYFGPCVVHTVQRRPLILAEDCDEVVTKGHKRILFRTLSYPNPKIFNTDFTAFHPDAVRYMGEHGVQLIGIDTPSVDEFSSKDLPSHHQLIAFNICNLEGLILEHVQDGEYDLVALPLKLEDFDASPVRAVLVQRS